MLILTQQTKAMAEIAAIDPVVAANIRTIRESGDKRLIDQMQQDALEDGPDRGAVEKARANRSRDNC